MIDRLYDFTLISDVSCPESGLLSNVQCTDLKIREKE